MNDNKRVLYSCSIATEVMKNPEAATSFICCVADQVSMVELERIHKSFFESVKTSPTKTNTNN